MKNVTKILTVVVLCGAMFASTQRTTTLGGAQFWPGDEANIGNFPAQANNHGYVQLSGIGVATEDTEGTENTGASILFQKDATTWGFNYGSNDWVNMTWGDGTMGVSFGLANYSNNLTAMTCDDPATEAVEVDTDCARENTGYKLGYGNTFSFGELGVHYKDTGVEGSDAELDVYMKSDFGFWLFDDTYVAATDLTNDMKIRADFFSHMDAGGADVVYGWGIDMNMADVGHVHQTATLGVEANMTDWATIRAGYKWTHVLSADDTPMVGTAQVGVVADADYAPASDDYAAAMIAETGVSDGTFSWGLGFNWGGLTADFKVESSLLLDPIGTITGNNDAGGGLTDTGITLTYSF